MNDADKKAEGEMRARAISRLLWVYPDPTNRSRPILMSSEGDQQPVADTDLGGSYFAMFDMFGEPATFMPVLGEANPLVQCNAAQNNKNRQVAQNVDNRTRLMEQVGIAG